MLRGLLDVAHAVACLWMAVDGGGMVFVERGWLDMTLVWLARRAPDGP